MTIRRLDPHTINQIAAGEVVQDSSSALKELLENALDAGSSRITVDLLHGGRGLLRVSDNGIGMSEEDLLLAVERHATSKLQTVEDLETLQSFGFRGEALPSIASISRMQLISSTGGDEGHCLSIEGGKILHQGPMAREQGTTVEIRDLFFNVPARLKFQKSLSADLAQCSRVARWMALIHPEISITLRADQSEVFTAPGLAADLKSMHTRAASLLKEEWEQAGHLELSSGSLRLQLILAPPEHHRPNRTDQIVALNDRLVQCPQVSWVIREAFAQRLEQGRHPAFIAKIWMPASWLDVNVHPQKREVRLREEKELRALLMRGTLMLLERLDHRSAEPLQGTSLPVGASSVAGASHWLHTWQERTAAQLSASCETLPCDPQEVSPQTSYATTDRTPSVEPPAAREAPPSFELPPDLVARLGGWALVRGTDHGYWQGGEELWAVDLEALRRAWWTQQIALTHELEAQPLLFPVEVPGLLATHAMESWKQWGFGWDPSHEALILTAIPHLLSQSEAVELLSSWVTEGTSHPNFLQLLGRLGSQSLSLPSLLVWLAHSGLSHCPMGKRLRIPLSEKTLQQYALHYEQSAPSSSPSEPPLPTWA